MGTHVRMFNTLLPAKNRQIACAVADRCISSRAVWGPTIYRMRETAIFFPGRFLRSCSHFMAA